MKQLRLDLNVKEIEDPVIRDNFFRVREFLRDELFGKFIGRHMSLTVSAAVTNERVPHRLGFKPEDVILTYCSANSVTFNYSLFDNLYMDFTTTGACTFRFYIGSHKEQD
jgi:hypothetical protein